MSFMDILQQYRSPSPQSAQTSPSHFDEVAREAPPQLLGRGVSGAFRAEQTPPFGQMVAQLFGSSNGSQRAGVLNQLLGSMNPAMLSGLAGGVLGRIFGSHDNAPATVPTLTPDQASQLTPEQVQEIATHAEKHDPGVVDRVGEFYGQHPALVKSLGGMALALVLGKMAH